MKSIMKYFYPNFVRDKNDEEIKDNTFRNTMIIIFGLLLVVCLWYYKYQYKNKKSSFSPTSSCGCNLQT